MKCVAFTNQQITDIIRFCAIGDALMNIDTTFKLGYFYVSVIAYKNLSLINPRTNTHPVKFNIQLIIYKDS